MGNFYCIQTEYEWKEERYNLIGHLDSLNGRATESEEASLRDEFKKLSKWLEENKPEQWVECNRQNTSVGDTVQRKKVTPQSPDVFRLVEFIPRSESRFALWHESKNETQMDCHMSNFEIDIKDK